MKWGWSRGQGADQYGVGRVGEDVRDDVRDACEVMRKRGRMDEKGRAGMGYRQRIGVKGDAGDGERD